MKHLAARFVRSTKHENILHVVDPYLDLRFLFKNLIELDENLKKRNLNINVLTVASDYMKWWNCFKILNSTDDKELKIRCRSALLNNSLGLLNVLKLPNLVKNHECNFQFSNNCEKFLKTKIEGLTEFKSFITSLISNYSEKLIQFCPPYIIRIALIEACNLNIIDYPLIENKLQSALCVPGISLPSMIACFVQKRFGLTNQWPITLYSVGEQYSAHVNETSKYSQKSVCCILELNNEETKNDNKLFMLLNNIFCVLSIDLSRLKILHVSPPNLLLAESSAFEIYFSCNTTENLLLARISYYNKYISRRLNVTYNNELKNSDNMYKFVSMKFLEIDLNSLFKCFVNN